MTEVKLKTCPFCGSEAEMLEHTKSYSIRCTKCNCMQAMWSFNKTEAINSWNTRYEPPRKFTEGDIFYYINKEGDILDDEFYAATSDFALLYMGNFFSTRKEAEEHKDEIMKKFEEVYERIEK